MLNEDLNVNYYVIKDIILILQKNNLIIKLKNLAFYMAIELMNKVLHFLEQREFYKLWIP